MHTFMFPNEALMLIILIIHWVIVIRLANDVVDGVVIEIAQELAFFWIWLWRICIFMNSLEPLITTIHPINQFMLGCQMHTWSL